jgi:hypothetical protein
MLDSRFCRFAIIIRFEHSLELFDQQNLLGFVDRTEFGKLAIQGRKVIENGPNNTLASSSCFETVGVFFLLFF